MYVHLVDRAGGNSALVDYVLHEKPWDDFETLCEQIDLERDSRLAHR